MDHVTALIADSRERDEVLRTIADAVPYMWTAGPDGAIHYASPSWLAYTGLTLEQTRSSWSTIIHPDDLPSIASVRVAGVESGKPYEALCRIRRASDRTYRWFITRATPLRNADGHIVRWLGNAIDIDEQKRAAEAQEFLAAATETLVSSLDYEATLRQVARLAVPRLADWCAVDLLDPHGSLHRVAVTHPDPAKEALAWALLERYPPNPDDPNDGLYRVVRSGQPELVPDIPPELIELGARDAEHLRIIRELQLRSYILVPLTARGRVLGTFSLIAAESGRRYTPKDLTLVQDLARSAALAIDNARLFRDVQRSTEQIQALNEALEARVRERTAELEEANQELESFCYSVSHDLRAPLRHVVGFAQLLARRAGPTLDEQSQGYITTISEAATQGARLVDDLLDFSRLGRSELNKSSVALPDLIASVQRELASECEGRTITWQIGALPPVQADPALLRIACKNLLSNALKFTRPQPEPRIEITAELRATELELCVRDNGVGFDPQFEDKLFGVFQRLHSAEEFEGTGIGLANVQRIIARHGGRTWAKGAVGLGAAFFFTLPHAQDPSQ
jgi:PAS domain S-box-containing protein